MFAWVHVCVIEIRWNYLLWWLRKKMVWLENCESIVWYLPVLAEVIGALKMFATHFAWEGNLWTFMSALMDHQIVWFCKSSLTIFANIFAFWAHFTTKVIALNFQYGEHFEITTFFVRYSVWLNNCDDCLVCVRSVFLLFRSLRNCVFAC